MIKTNVPPSSIMLRKELTMKRTMICFSFFLIPLLMTTGCGGDKIDFPEPATEKTANAYVANAGTLKISSTEYAADFGTVTVAENRDKTASRLIHLPFIRIHARSKKPLEPIFCFSGGPGQSNMNWHWESIGYLLSEYDVVAVGYRGVDGSTVLDCPEVAEAFHGAGDLLGEESLKAIGRAWNASARRLTAQGIDLDGYTMTECIEDNEAVREALGYERINLLSASYGTRVAYFYGLAHPQSINRSAMIGVNPPGRFVWDPEMIDGQLKRYADLWARDAKASSRSKDLYATLRTVLTAMPRRWLFFPINPGKVKVVTFCLLFQRDTAAMVFDAYVAAAQGDASGLALLSLAYDHVMPSMSTWGDLAAKAVSADFDPGRDYYRDMEQTGTPLGSPLSTLLWGPLNFSRWPMRSLPEEFRKARPSAVETLLLSGSNDFSTPAEFATRELLPYLKNGKQVILSEYGHVGDLLNGNPENTMRILTGFYKSGMADTSMNTYVPMDFNVRWGFPLIAKVALAVIVVLILLLILLAIWLIRKIRSGKKKKSAKTS
jgi:pimeloyl-ACP methyl ester carboxylesterase